VKASGSQILIDALTQEKVEHLFGYPGATIVTIYDELEKSSIKHILVRHEQAAVHMADGYARASGKVGVCLVTSGPGATNAVTGIATAFMDSIPLVVLTGQVPTAIIGNDAFQEVDIIGISRTITKHNYMVSRVEDLGTVMKEAFHIAATGRPGPVVVDLPKDVLLGECEYEYPDQVHLPGYKPTLVGNARQIMRAVKLIRESRKPVIFSGGGVILGNASEELRRVVEQTQIPVTSSLMGLGGVSGDHPLWLGMPGMHGTQPANLALTECDLIIAVGARFDDRVTGNLDKFAP